MKSSSFGICFIHTIRYTKIWATKGSRWRHPAFQDSIKLAEETSFALQQRAKRSHMTTYKGYTQSTFIYALSPWLLAFSIKNECSMSSLICINTFLAVSESSTVPLKCIRSRVHSTAEDWKYAQQVWMNLHFCTQFELMSVTIILFLMRSLSTLWWWGRAKAWI